MEAEGRRNWVWIFRTAFVVGLTSMFFGKFALAGLTLTCALFALLVVQLWRGYALNRAWIETFSRRKHPIRYWLAILVNVLALCWLASMTLEGFHRGLRF